MERPKILYVEDHLESALLVKTILKNICEVYFTENFEETFDFLPKNNVDLILLDISLPGEKNGLEVLKVLKSDTNYSKLPVIALTAYAMAGDKERLLKAGCDDYIGKPMNRHILVEKVKKYLKIE
jgi:CheY-like chemotaxis protein